MATDNNEIRTAPADLHERMYDTVERLERVQRDIAEFRREYQRLRANPAALDVDTLGEPIDPVVATDAVLHGLEQAGGELRSAESWLRGTRGQFASRLKLTDQASEDLERRISRRRSPVERSR